ncbi:MAG: hypothetical protein ACR2GY_02965 [Phycisphaerales bacterium]
MHQTRYRRGVSSRVALVLAVSLALIAVGIAALRWESRETSEERIDRLSSEAERAFARFDYVLIADATDDGALLRHAVVVGEALGTDEQRTLLLQAAGRYLRLTGLDAQAEDYLAWRQQQGATLLPMEVIETLPGYTFLKRESNDATFDSADDVFVALWDLHRRWLDGDCVPEAVATTDGSALIQYRELRVGQIGPPALPPEWREHWTGGRSLGCNQLTQTALPLQQRVEAGPVLGGFVTAAVRYHDGVARPTTWSFFWDKDKRIWVLTYIILPNVANELFRAPEI